MTALAPARNRPAQKDESLWTRWLNTQRAHIPAGDIRFLRIGRGPTVVLLHSLGTQLEYFIPLLDVLDRNLDIVVPDLPGHGLSSAPPVEYSSVFFIDAVEQLLDRLNLGNVLLVGDSIGASIGLGLAARRNARLSGLIAINPYDYGLRGRIRRTSRLANVLLEAMTWPAIVPALVRLATKEIVREVMKGGVQDPHKLPSELVDEMWESSRLPGHAQAFLSSARHWESWIAAREGYSRVELPITLVYGDHDWSRPEEREANGRALRTARTVAISSCGHFACLDQPRLIAHLIRNRISQRWST